MSAQPTWSAVQLFEPSPTAMPIIDAELKHYGRLWVPLGCVAPTKALARWQKGGKHQPALCAAYQAGQCPAGEACANAHVLAPFVAEVRRVLLERPFVNCCHEHGDLASKRADFQALLQRRRVEFRSEAGAIPILPAWLAVTAFFDSVAKEDPTSTAVITFDLAKVCNLHQRLQCTYGADCRNVHLCRNFWGCVPADHKQAADRATAVPAEAKPVVPAPVHAEPPQCLRVVSRAPPAPASPSPFAGRPPAPTPAPAPPAPRWAAPAGPLRPAAGPPPVVVGPPPPRVLPPPAAAVRVGGGVYSGPPVMVGAPAMAPPMMAHPSGPVMLPPQPLAPRPASLGPSPAAERPLSRLMEKVCQDLSAKGPPKGHAKPLGPSNSRPSPPPAVAPVQPPPSPPRALSPISPASASSAAALARGSPSFSLFDRLLPSGSPAGSHHVSSKSSDAEMEDLLSSIADFSEDDSLGHDYDSESLHSEESGRPSPKEACRPWTVDWLDAAAVGIQLPWAMVEQLRETSA